MFKLQRLEITGFKSFADYTEIVFTGNGITAVVGPNGCGKSNVSESIAWVLGEQRAKALRGSEMKDVVFQGTKNRKPSGMAEVVLHLVKEEDAFFTDEEDLSEIDEALGDLDENAVNIDEYETSETPSEIESVQLSTLNSQLATDADGFHIEEVEKARAAQVGSIQTIQTKAKSKRHWRSRSFALDYAPGEAIAVTRRLYLSGESEYLLNGKACRLRDIQDLFAGTGLSGAHYAIIEQGRIGQILSAKPSDRRNLIEEAAGISKFRTRQRAAETRLESAKTNLNRISDIVSEVDKQANSLRRQAAKTRRYKIMREELRVLLKQLFTAEGRQLSHLVDELETGLAEAVASERKLFAEVAEKDEAFRKATTEARFAEEKLADLRQKHSENALERDRASREHRYQQEQIANLERRSAVLEGEIESTEQRLQLLKNEVEKLRKEEREDRAEAEKNEVALREAEKKHHEKTIELRETEAQLEKERAALLQHTAAVERFAEIRRQLENNLERLKERAEGLQRESVRAEENRAEHRTESENLAQKIETEKVKLENLHVEKQTILAAASEARDHLRKVEEVLRNLRNEFSRKKNRLETLQELEEKRAVYAPQVQKLFSAEEKIGVKFAGVLADKLTVDERAEKAVESLFGVYLQSVLVESEEDARKTIAFLNENSVGRIAVLVQSPKSKIQSQLEVQSSKFKVQSSEIGDQNPNSQIANFLGISDNFAEILSEIFPREMSAQLVENLDGLTAKDNEIFVDYAGNLLIGGRLFVGGKTNANEKNDSLLAFKRELRELGKSTLELGADIEKAESGAEKARKKLAEKEEKIVDLQSLIVKIERDLLGLEIQQKTVKQEIERAERHQKVVADETNQIERELTQLKQKASEAETNAEKAERARTEAARKLENISKNLNDARARAEAENAVLNEKRMLAATSGERRRSAQNALRRLETEEKEFASRLSRQNMEILESEGARKKINESIRGIERKIASAESEQTREQNDLAKATENLKTARESADAMSAELAELNKKSADARNERAALEIRQTEAITKLRNLNEKCSYELNLSLIELVENEKTGTDFDLEAARAQTEDLREKLENYGAINMLAVEELSEAEERLSFLTAQRQDIIDGIAAAEAALREIKERSREKFKQAFAAINKNFIEFFQELFGGGRGEMMMLEAEDVLEAGIEIVAQPPGKRLQNILLLSGGEKAMTAIALVMAIFKYRPAPFCLLDEVDAPLDDANVGRFVNKIAEMSEKTQFIVITHNKRTMEAARALYGVTMQEAGVSKVVSVKFE